MAKAGAAPNMLMDLARHGDADLTVAFYCRTLVADRAEALRALPDLTGQPTRKLRAAATGTGDATPFPADFIPQDAKQNDKCKECSRQVTGPWRIRTSDQGIMSPLL